jgi:hypothetical protein
MTNTAGFPSCANSVAIIAVAYSLFIEVFCAEYDRGGCEVRWEDFAWDNWNVTFGTGDER